MRIVFFGTPQFAVPTLRALLAGPHSVSTVVSQPDRRRGRGRGLTPSPVAQLGLDAGIAVLRPERVGEASVREALSEAKPDVGVVVAFGQFLPKSIRELPKAGFLLNAHASLLPRYRGAAPIVRAMLAGERRTGISIMRVEREMDAGPVAEVREIEIGPTQTGAELSERLAALAAEATLAVLDRVAAGSLRWTEQDHAAATLAPKLERSEARIDWRRPADALALQVRALSPRPGATTHLDGAPLRILDARSETAGKDLAPGVVRRPESGGLYVGSGSGSLRVLRLQRAGGRPLDTDAFLRGSPVPDGAHLGDDPRNG